MARFINSLLGAAALLALGQAAQAQPYPSHRAVAHGDCARLSVVDASRGELPTHRGRGQMWVEGRQGAEYTLMVSNDCRFPVLANLSIDGLNAIDGSRASLSGQGYIIAPGQSAQIKGWRKNMQQTSAFYFTFPEDSYGGRTSRDENLGVIGAAFFKPRDWREPEVIAMENREFSKRSESQDSAARGMGPAAPGSMMAPKSAPSPSLGTGYGRDMHDPAQRARFERESAPFSKVAIRYETRAALIAKGIIEEPRWQRRGDRPDPFPDAGRFTPAPPARPGEPPWR